ncbi:hypothetical protein [Bacillus sp. V33-4]|uniref:hypothetical protein n=1 Tax=Bacillus sp. V33-4 TaxID=2054169 RepID=UPI000C77987D|nr:hypothetical protein [Bacillus sp. V33-4]PLR83678.1 hypothetical protein CVD23_13680 [Bacillus sp. V33-4]
MKRLLPMMFLTILILLGVSLLIFVLRMVWFPPGSMGMMMGRTMMFQHMFFWFGQMFWIFLIIIGVIMFIWLIINKKNKN